MAGLMDDLIAFLHARLDEDEKEAATASPGPWHANPEQDEVVAVDGETVADGFALNSQQLRATVRHIVRHDPARVLREVEAKRRILELHKAVHYRQYDPPAWICLECSSRDDDHYHVTDAPCETVRLLALPYSDHPGYKEAWKP
jgi:hypothetical protein